MQKFCPARKSVHYASKYKKRLCQNDEALVWRFADKEIEKLPFESDECSGMSNITSTEEDPMGACKVCTAKKKQNETTWECWARSTFLNVFSIITLGRTEKGQKTDLEQDTIPESGGNVFVIVWCNVQNKILVLGSKKWADKGLNKLKQPRGAA